MRMTEKELQALLKDSIPLRHQGEGRRLSYLQEQQFLEKIQRGEYRSISVHPFSEIAEEIGSEEWDVEPRKACEYISVILISQSVRAAMAGGAPPDSVNEFGDRMLVRLSQTEEISEMEAILNDAAVGCAYLVFRGNSETAKDLTARTRRYVEKHIHEKIYLLQISESLGVSKSYLSRVFSRSEGIPLQNYIQREKVEEGARMLLDSSISVSDIARSLSFQSPSSFAEAFRKWKGVSPSRFREQYFVEETKK